MLTSDFSKAVQECSPETIRAMLDAGADVRYVRPHNYTAMIDVLHRWKCDDEEDEAALVPLMQLLIERGADVNAISDYGESALRVAARRGRFDIVWLLLQAGADEMQLEWSPLHRAVALGTVEDIREQIKSGADLKARDYWERTPWLLSLQVGDLNKSAILLDAGADRTDRGRCGKTALMYPIEGGHTPMVQWLLALGIDPNEKDDHGGTALISASGNGHTEIVRMLLARGADAHYRENSRAAISCAGNLEIVRLLTGLGADINEVNQNIRDKLTGLANSEALECSPEEYSAAKHRLFGRDNPERMNFPFWKSMVVRGSSAYSARKHFGAEKSDGEPVWCYSRFGKSLNELPDGRVIEIGGEHEDFYDPDFCIYNDVVVHRGDGTFDIFGYPKDVFPPTDFHTATLVGRNIYVIGRLGYAGERQYGTTPVFCLDTGTLCFETIHTTGDMPGWIFSHKAVLVGDVILVSSGKICRSDDGVEVTEENSQVFALDLKSMRWTRH